MLVVDDNATNRHILEEMLGRWRMRPETVEGGRTALARLTEAADAGQPFPLVLLDANMPEMDGFALAASIREDPRLAGAVRHDAHLRREARRQRAVPALGIANYVTKPIRQQELYAAVAQALGAQSRRRRPRSGSRRRRRRDAASRPLRILLAEDNPVNRQLAIALLNRRGHIVTVAENGQEAVDHVERERFDLVLMDVQMPVMGGFEATRIIRERERASGGHIPIVALTARAMNGDRELCLAAGMDEYLAKPLRAADLYATVDAFGAAAPAPEARRWASGSDGHPAADALLERFLGDRRLFLARWPRRSSTISPCCSATWTPPWPRAICRPSSTRPTASRARPATSGMPRRSKRRSTSSSWAALGRVKVWRRRPPSFIGRWTSWCGCFGRRSREPVGDK